MNSCPENANGSVRYPRTGSHPFQLTTTVALNAGAETEQSLFVESKIDEREGDTIAEVVPSRRCQKICGSTCRRDFVGYLIFVSAVHGSGVSSV